MKLWTLTTISLFGVIDATCTHGTYLHRRDAEPFGYDYANGPLVWHTLSTNNTLCRTGSHQSPVNIDDTMRAVSVNLTIQEGGIVDGVFANLGTTLQVTPKNGERFISMNNTQYSLKQFHFHTPSEHHINGEYFPLEMHMVHQSNDPTDKKLLVLGILFDVGDVSNATCTICELSSLIPMISTREKSVDLSSQHLDLSKLVNALDPQSLVTYLGSLTTPPCTEGVTWLVHNKPLEIAPWTYTSFKRALKYNARITEGPPGAKNIILAAG